MTPLGNPGVVRTVLSRSRRGVAREGYHDPTAGWAGAAPTRSALTLRLALATFGVVVCGVGAALFVTIVDAPVMAAVLAVLGLIAVLDAVVVTARKRRGEPG
jgi:hypothetical protein